MTSLEHDSAKSMEVQRRRRRYGRLCWRVVRTCECHFNEAVSIAFDTRDEAERCLRVLDEDAQKWHSPLEAT